MPRCTNWLPRWPSTKGPTCQSREYQGQVQLLRQEDPLEEGMQSTSTLACTTPVRAWRAAAVCGVRAGHKEHTQSLLTSQCSSCREVWLPKPLWHFFFMVRLQTPLILPKHSVRFSGIKSVLLPLQMHSP